MSIPPFEIKKRQLLYAGLAASLGLLLIAMLLWSLGGDMALESLESSSPPKETSITTAGRQVNPQEVWVERMETENKLTNEKLSALEKLFMASIQERAKERDQDQLNQQQACPGWSPENENASSPLNAVLPPPPSNGQSSHGDYPQGNYSYGTHGTNSGSSSGVKKIMLKLSNPVLDLHSSEKSGTGKSVHRGTLEDTLPAGAFAKAILLGGVDASTSVSSPSDPRPVLLRVTDHGNLPRKFKSDLKACHILASSYGDLSSERVYMRLEKLTCTERLTGEISETQVAGYVVGEDGRAGVRGIVVDKAGPLIRNSLVGGFFSGMAHFFESQQQRSFFPVSPQGQTPIFMPQQALTAGGLQGTSQALEKYADFFIKRAEQLQPVLQIAAGREVDVVFTEGTKFGDTTVRRSLSKIRNRSRKQTLQRMEEQGDSQNWRPIETGSYETSSFESGSQNSEVFESPFNNPQIGDEE